MLVRIQHHPSRAELLPPLLGSLDPLRVEVSTHKSFPPNPWAGYHKALSGLPEADSHVCVLQDDVRVCQNFPQAVTRIAEANSDNIVCLFLANLPLRVSRLALREGKRGKHYIETYLRTNEFCPVVGVLWPTHKAREFIHWTDENPRKLGHPEPRSDDGVLGRWCALTKQLVRFTVPSIVQHPDQVKSLIGRQSHWGKDKGRVALLYCEGDPLEYDWS